MASDEALKPEEIEKLRPRLEIGADVGPQAIKRLLATIDALREELKQCRKEKNDLVLIAYPAMDERDALRDEVKRYREALETYADSGDGQTDTGFVARAALTPKEQDNAS